MPRSVNPLDYVQPYAHAVLLMGFLIVLMARGCESIGHRYIDRASAKQGTAINNFNDKWDSDTQAIEDKITAEKKQDKPDSEALKKLDQELVALRKDRSEAQQRLQKGAWRDLTIVARDAKANHAISGYWYETLFVVGTMLLVVGLITVGFRGERAERMICLIMLAIIVFSLYVGGAAWISPLAGVLR